MISPKYKLNEYKCLKKKHLKEYHHYIYKMNKPKYTKCENDMCERYTLLTICAGCLINGIKSEKKEISNINKTRMNEFVKFPVGLEKLPLKNMWVGTGGADNKHLWKKTLKGNNGIPCGKVNNITVVDLDLYKLKEKGLESEFIKEFGEDYVEKFNTLTQKTTSGGEHLFFQYVEEFKKGTNNAFHQIDIKNDGGYVIGAGSKCYVKQDKEKPVSQKRVGEYKIINSSEVKTIPDKLKEWIISNIMKKDKVYKSDKVREEKQIKLHSSIGYYCYNITDDKCKEIVSKLPEIYWTAHEQWLILATAMKAMDKCELFLKMCAEHPKTNYTNPNHPENVKQLNGIKRHYDINAVEHIFNKAVQNVIEGKETTYRTYVDYIKYKPTLISELKSPTKKGEWDKLGKHITLPKDKKCIVIKSDTGTGKTTIIKEYLRNQPNCKFISIVSRISLAEEQYAIFRDSGISCKLYNEQKTWFQEDDSMVICVDSLSRLAGNDFSEYIFFMDEYNSLVEHLFSSSTLHNKRCDVFTLLCKYMKQCRQLFCVDADLQKHTLQLLDYNNIDYDLYINTYQHNKNVKAQEIFKVDKYIEKLVDSESFIMCCDSKSSAIKVGRDNFDKLKLTTEEEEEYSGMMVFKDEKGIVVCITSDNDTYVQLDKFKRVIMSPKIIYGIDSTIEREVFCWYEEHTINPRMMVQQMCRARNIKNIYYIFFKKSFKQEKFLNLEETYSHIKKIDGYAIWKELWLTEENDIWMKIMSVIMFNEDCYNTNKFSHFRNLIQERGIILNDMIGQTERSPLSKMKMEYKKEQKDNFDKNHPKIKELNELLCIPNKLIDDYKELFLYENKLSQNQLAIKWIIKGGVSLDSTLSNKSDCNYNKIKSRNYKLVFLEELMKKCGINRKDDLIAKNGLEEKDAKEIWDRTKELLRIRLTAIEFGPQTKIDDLKNEKLNKVELNLDLTKPEDCSLCIEKGMSQIFGGSVLIPYIPTQAQIDSGKTQMSYTKINIFNTTRKTKDKVKYTVKTINPDYFIYHQKIGQYRNKDCRVESFEWEFGKEVMNHHSEIVMEQNIELNKWEVKPIEEEEIDFENPKPIAGFHLTNEEMDKLF